jgi:hypothetical protein
MIWHGVWSGRGVWRVAGALVNSVGQALRTEESVLPQVNVVENPEGDGDMKKCAFFSRFDQALIGSNDKFRKAILSARWRPSASAHRGYCDVGAIFSAMRRAPSRGRARGQPARVRLAGRNRALAGHRVKEDERILRRGLLVLARHQLAIPL